MAENKDRFWVDCLNGKHECFGYNETLSIEVNVNGVLFTILLPEYLGAIDVLSASISGDLMHVIGRQKEEWSEGEHLGAVVVAKRMNENTFATVVWHETYPWALKKLGLEPELKEKAAKAKRSKKKD